MAALVIFLVAISFAVLNGADVEEYARIPCLNLLQSREQRASLCQNEIKAVVEKVRKQLENGIPSLGVPPMDPLQIDEVSFDFDNSLIQGPLSLTNLQVKGITEFVLTDGKVTLPSGTVDFGLRFDSIELTTDYVGNLEILNLVNLFGSGKIDLTLSNLDIVLKVYLSIKILPPKVERIKDVSIQVTLPSTEAKITGLLDDEYMSDLISRQLSDTLTFLAKEEEERINAGLYKVIMYIVETIINPILENKENEKLSDEEHYRLVLTTVEQTIQVMNENNFFSTWFTKELFNMRRF